MSAFTRTVISLSFLAGSKAVHLLGSSSGDASGEVVACENGKKLYAATIEAAGDHSSVDNSKLLTENAGCVIEDSKTFERYSFQLSRDGKSVEICLPAFVGSWQKENYDVNLVCQNDLTRPITSGDEYGVLRLSTTKLILTTVDALQFSLTYVVSDKQDAALGVNVSRFSLWWSTQCLKKDSTPDYSLEPYVVAFADRHDKRYNLLSDGLYLRELNCSIRTKTNSQISQPFFHDFETQTQVCLPAHFDLSSALLQCDIIPDPSFEFGQGASITLWKMRSAVDPTEYKIADPKQGSYVNGYDLEKVSLPNL